MSKATIIPGSKPVINPMLDLFKVPPTDFSIASRRKVPVHPFTTGITPVDFQIDPQSEYIDLSQSEFELELKLKKSDGTRLTAAATSNLFLANNFAHSLFKQISVRFNNTLISPQTDTYAYKALIDTALNFDRDDGETILKPQGWVNGLNPPIGQLTANQLDVTHADHAALPESQRFALKQMREECGEYVNKTHVLRFKPMIEVFHLSKLLVPQVQIGIQLFFNTPDFFTLRYRSTDTLRLNVADIKIKLLLCQVKVNTDLFRDLAITMDKSVVSYPTVRSEVRTYNLGATERMFEINNPFQNRTPNLIVVGLVEAAAFNGHVEKNPFAFQKFGLTSIKQLVKGEKYPYETMELNHDSDQLDMRGYHRFLEATSCLRKSKGNMVTRKEWGQGRAFTLFAFDNAANGFLHSPVLNPKLSGELQLMLHFGADPAVNVTVIVYGEFENLLEVDSNKAVLYNVYDGTR